MSDMIEHISNAIEKYIIITCGYPNALYMSQKNISRLYNDIKSYRFIDSMEIIFNMFGCYIYTDQTIVRPNYILVTKLDNKIIPIEKSCCDDISYMCAQFVEYKIVDNITEEE